MSSSTHRSWGRGITADRGGWFISRVMSARTHRVGIRDGERGERVGKGMGRGGKDSIKGSKGHEREDNDRIGKGKTGKERIWTDREIKDRKEGRLGRGLGRTVKGRI